MVKPDPKHNYYADLSLPTTCSIDEVRKQYRRLALLYHPDRNAGKEEEVVPKFQAIQTAHEVLSDATLKAKYDGDRRKAGLYPLNRPAGGGGAAGYSAASAQSAYPPPPRRTQPGVWSRPPGAGTNGGAGGTAPTGADRFTNFTRPPAPTARKDATTDRKNNFNAWQNLNTAQERQQQQQQQQSQRFASGTAPPPPPSPVNSSNRPRPPPPPRADTKLPGSEDDIRGTGFNYHKPSAGFNDPGLDPRQTAWAAHHYQKNGANSPSAASAATAGVGRSNTTRTPRKPTGFDPNAPGSDERPAPAEQSGYAHSHRHRSEDFGQMPRGTGMGFMPPPPPPMPPSMSPTSPNSARPFGESLRPSKSRGGEGEQVPYAEGTRTRTPYTNFSGERTPFTRTGSGDGEGLRRTASTRDTTKLNGSSGAAGRARSTSPLAKKKGFVEYSDSDVTDNGRSSEESEEGAGGTESQSRPGTASTSQQQAEGRFSEGVYSNRRMKVPTPPSRMNGSRPGSKGGDSTADIRPGMEGMGMKGSSKNMYVGDDFFSVDSTPAPTPTSTQHDAFNSRWGDNTYPDDGGRRDGDAFAGFEGGDAFESAEQHDAFQRARQRDVFESERWRERMFGSLDAMYDKIDGMKRGGVSVPQWAFPSSVMPGVRKASRGGGVRGGVSRTSTRPIPIPPRKVSATTRLHCDGKVMTDHEKAFVFVHQELGKQMGESAATTGLDLDVFKILVERMGTGQGTGNGVLDAVLGRAMELFPCAVASSPLSAFHHDRLNWGDGFCANRFDDSFSFPFSQDMFNASGHPTHARSEEKINTTFTPEGWEGRFTASGDYFAPPTGMGKGERVSAGGRKGSGSPGKRMRSVRSTNSSLHVPPSTTPMGMPPPLSHSPGGGSAAGESDGGVKFPKEHWEKTFKDASWSWPPPPPPGLPASLAGRGAPRVPGRKGSKRSEKWQQAEHVGEEQVGQEESPVGGGVGAGDEDAMDIDSTPPAAKHQTQQESEKVGEGTPTTQNGNGKEARMYAVPPSAWRQSQTNGHAASNRGSGGGANGNLKTNLDDLAHVEPLARTTNSAGLGSLSDVHDTLPFTSEASTTIPAHDDVEQMPATPMPAIPKAPEPPTKLTKQSWHAFAANFGAYLQAFHAFNTSMIHHFAAREQSAQDLLGVGNMKWLESAGDTMGGGGGSAGFGTYLQGVKEDERVRELWGVGCERHAEAVRGFGGVRERVRRLGAGGGLAEH
ncbi:hypothetical protein LTR56_015761 [Elasticomyces elasticus]|nr:hypothetical protein LTR56_015761 [Elasticomyces elasticus]KAK3661972.1 hypothetical protein LTR22_007143 [Elasticomyces elasticus]KAK4933139.1 hypothetical protein LTR49_000623 [Elasticomyces elasticus]KAK5755882.1 hypothetical protein LTS12_013999 [Elasticomyces elasticus]